MLFSYHAQHLGIAQPTTRFQDTDVSFYFAYGVSNAPREPPGSLRRLLRKSQGLRIRRKLRDRRKPDENKVNYLDLHFSVATVILNGQESLATVEPGG